MCFLFFQANFILVPFPTHHQQVPSLSLHLCILLTCYAEISGNENVWGNEKTFYLIFHRYAMEGEEGGSLNTNNLLPPVQILDPEAEMDQRPTGLYSYYFYF